MTDRGFAYCPRCATPLVEKEGGGRSRPTCPAQGCEFVHWNNPTPVVAGIVEHEGAVIVVRNVGWPGSTAMGPSKK